MVARRLSEAIKRVKKSRRRGIKEIERLIKKATLNDEEKEHIHFCIEVYKKALNIYEHRTPEPSALLFCSIIESIGHFGKPFNSSKERFVNAVLTAFESPDWKYFLNAVIDEALQKLDKTRIDLSRMSENEQDRLRSTGEDITKDLLEKIYKEYRCAFSHRLKQLPAEVRIASCIGLGTLVVHSGSERRLVM